MLTHDEPSWVNRGASPPSRPLLETKSRRPALPNCPRVQDWPLVVSAIWMSSAWRLHRVQRAHQHRTGSLRRTGHPYRSALACRTSLPVTVQLAVVATTDLASVPDCPYSPLDRFGGIENINNSGSAVFSLDSRSNQKSRLAFQAHQAQFEN